VRLPGADEGSRLTWLGHSTVLIELDGTRILTDPLLRARVLHLRRRAGPVGVNGPLDAVLLSHVHWDHLDLRSLERLGRSTPILAPRGSRRILRRFDRVQELEAGEQIDLGAVDVAATPAVHEVGRWRGKNSAAIGFVLRGSRSVYFAGDTDLFEAMEELGPLDVALLPVGGWGPQVPAGHLDPLRAAKALQLLRPRVAIPIHWGTYATIFAQPSRTAGEEFRRHAHGLAPEVDVQVLPVGGSAAF
jgi:L-ascorbate metabolism protein UlaG (beta-lactamase superfamily)